MKRQKDYLPLKLPNLFTNGSKTERVASFSFLNVIFDENILRILIYNLMRTKSLKIFEFFIYQSIYSAKTNSRAYILLLLTPTRAIEILYGEVQKKTI